MSDIGQRKAQLQDEMKRAGVVQLIELERKKENKKEKDFRKKMKLLREGIEICHHNVVRFF
jgi:hypothetical protein